MSKKIVIDKEKVERSEHSELIKTAISLLIKHGVATELSTDESIETVIEKILQPKHMNDIYTWKQVKDAVLKATEQSIIEQMKAKEFAEWCSINGWYFYTKDNLWRKHASGGFEYKTTEELFNQFANR